MYLMNDDKSKFMCGCCRAITTVENILQAPNPFNANSEPICGCPHCFSVEDFERICDVDGCSSANVSGMKIDDGYKFLCRLHTPDLSKNNGTE